MQNNMDFVQDVFGVEGTCVGHNVPTFVLQHLVSNNRQMILQFLV